MPRSPIEEALWNGANGTVRFARRSRGERRSTRCGASGGWDWDWRTARCRRRSCDSCASRAELGLPSGALGRRCSASCRVRRDDRLQRADESDGRSLRAGRARVRRGEERPHQGVRQPARTPTPTMFADLRTNVHNFWDRGLLGMALDPNFPATPYVYVLYTYDARPSEATAPALGHAGCDLGRVPDAAWRRHRTAVSSAAGCRACRPNGNVMTGSEQVLVEDWCQQYPSHSVGTVEFGPDGALYASAGDGASFNFADYGQDGSPVNPCGDPPGGVGCRTHAADRRRRSPAQPGPAHERRSGRRSTARSSASTRRPVRPCRPTRCSATPIANARRIIAHGLRNPFRFAFRPGTSEIWVGDVGWSDWEEINTHRQPDRLRRRELRLAVLRGQPAAAGLRRADLSICENLYAERGHECRYYAYRHSDKVVPGESCPTGSSSISGSRSSSRRPAARFPAAYQGALFFSDYSRDCIWAMKKGGNPKPNPGQLETFVAGRRQPGEHRVRPRRQPLLRRLRRRDDPTGRSLLSAPPPGGTTFGQPTHYPTGANAHGAALANLNGDGQARPRRRECGEQQR